VWVRLFDGGLGTGCILLSLDNYNKYKPDMPTSQLGPCQVETMEDWVDSWDHHLGGICQAC